MCYCFYGSNPLNTPTEDDEEDINYYDAASSTSMEDTEDDLPQMIREIIEPYLEPAGEPLPEAPVNRHLFFDDDGNVISKEEFDWRNQNEEKMRIDEERAQNWAFRVNKIVFRHPRALLAYFRMVNLVNEVAEPDERITIPPIPPGVLVTLLDHPSFTDIPVEFQDDIYELLSYIYRHVE